VRRRSNRRARQRGADWVYRGVSYDEEGTPVDLVAPTYSSSAIALNNQTMVSWLYDSKNFSVGIVGGTPGPVSAAQPSASRAEGRRVRILGTFINVLCSANAGWIASANFNLGVRVGIFEQDPTDGDAILPAAFSMYAENGVQDQPAVWANSQRTNLWEARFRQVYTAGVNTGIIWVRKWVSFGPRGITLGSNEGLGLYFENDGNVATSLTRWCRSLVVDEG